MRLFNILSFVTLSTAGLLIKGTNGKSSQSCQPSTFSNLLGLQTIPGADVIEIEAEELKEFNSVSPHPRFESATINACEVRLYYINPGTNSSRVTVTVWLPTSLNSWNGRFFGTGGGGWQCSMGKHALNYAVSHGSAAATSDGGLHGTSFETDYTLLSPGNPDLYKYERLGHRAIHDMTVGSKKVIEKYYGKIASNNYYMGCSTGGRQGLMEASRYPEDYDGIIVGAPAALYPKFTVRLLAETATMNKYNTYPNPCEFESIRQASIEECDHLDGRIDTIVARPDLCKFTAQKAIGRTYLDTCDGNGEEKQVTSEAARIYQIALNGATDNNGNYLGSGFEIGFEGTLMDRGTLSTYVDQTTGKRFALPFPFSKQMVEHYLMKGLKEVDWTKVSLEDLTKWQEENIRETTGMLEPFEDLSEFRDRGGKIMWYHGQEDMIIPLGISYGKWDQIRQKMYPNLSVPAYVEKMQGFIRFYVIPGMSHCNLSPSRTGKAPTVDESILQQLIQWVEGGQTPDRLNIAGVSDPAISQVCQWPKRPKWTDNGKQLTCVDESFSVLGRLPPISEWPMLFIERLPIWLFLSVKKGAEEL